MEKRQKLFEELIREVDISYSLISEYDNRARSYGGVKLFQAESYMVKDIGNTPGITLTELAAQEKKTKGACSKILRKLIEKELVVQLRNEENLREYFLNLTPLGEHVYDAHRKLNEYYANRSQKLLERFSNEDIQTFIDVQKQLNICYVADIYDDTTLLTNEACG